MKYLCLAFTLLLASCASHYDRAGNYDDYQLSPAQAATVASDITAELGKRYPARTIFSFPHDDKNPLSASLESTIRSAGMGISDAVTPGYHRLIYRLQRFNEHQFIVVVTVNQRSFQLVWSDDDNALARLKTVTQYEGQ